MRFHIMFHGEKIASFREAAHRDQCLFYWMDRFPWAEYEVKND